MTRTSIRQFRAALADPADESRLTRAYREIARTPRHVAAMVGTEWAAWPAAAATARAFADWPTWQGGAGQEQPAAAAARSGASAFADWPIWNDGAARQQPAGA